MQEVKNIIVAGASAGGISTVCKLLSTFRGDMNAAVFIVIHLSKRSQSSLIINYFKKHTPLKCVVAEDGLAIRNSTAYLAPEDHHLFIDSGVMLVRKGAYENHYRPSIDVLFRSAAATYGSCVTGIILTGLLDDGVSGMSAIKRSGGMCLVQEPTDALFSGMPASVLNNLEADYVVPVHDMSDILKERLFAKTVCSPQDAPEDVHLEASITRRMSSGLEEMHKLGEMTPFTCPDCGGMLTRMTHSSILRFKCYTGHSFTADSLMDDQIRKTEESLWVAIRMMEERKNLLQSMAGNKPGNEKGSDSRTERWTALQTHIAQLKEMLLNIGRSREEDLR
jgi:two-component system chemotaxis response regulator CheB